MTKKENKFSDDYAMYYEFLIRRAHQCGRYGVAGADADIYRRFLRHASIYSSEMEAIKNKTERLWRKSEEEMLADYMVSCGEVKGYIKTAIDSVKKKNRFQLNDDQYNELEQAEILLADPNIETITQAIDRADKVMLEIKLFPQ